MMNENVLRNIYTDLCELSSTDLQKSYWILGDTTKQSSFVELINRLFDDDDFDSFVDSEAQLLGLSQSFLAKMKEIRAELNAYVEKQSEGKSHLDIIADPEWLAITKKTSAILVLWRKELGNPID